MFAVDSPTWLALAQAIMAAWQHSEQSFGASGLHSRRPTVCLALKPAAGDAGAGDVAGGDAQQAQHGAPGADPDGPGEAREAQRMSLGDGVSTRRLLLTCFTSDAAQKPRLEHGNEQKSSTVYTCWP